VFWSRYGGVGGLLLLAGAVVGAALFFVLFGFLLPPDRGEESVVPFMPIMGAFFGGLTGLGAGAAFLLGLFGWTRRRMRSVRSRAWIGAGSAAVGAALVWISVGIAWNSVYAWAVWGPIALFSALLAAVVAGPLTARAARRADKAEAVASVPVPA
jgi:hypothetical protein